eukprot:206737-Chlamydomonas_euryale.AAC.2
MDLHIDDGTGGATLNPKPKHMEQGAHRAKRILKRSRFPTCTSSSRPHKHHFIAPPQTPLHPTHTNTTSSHPHMHLFIPPTQTPLHPTHTYTTSSHPHKHHFIPPTQTPLHPTHTNTCLPHSRRWCQCAHALCAWWLWRARASAAARAACRRARAHCARSGFLAWQSFRRRWTSGRT